MGVILGALVDLLVVKKFEGIKAIVASTAIAEIVLGGFCNTVCLTLDRQLRMWGGNSNPLLFLTGGYILTIIFGSFYSYLLFSNRGQLSLTRLGL